jgi:hypothetical protein
VKRGRVQTLSLFPWPQARATILLPEGEGGAKRRMRVYGRRPTRRQRKPSPGRRAPTDLSLRERFWCCGARPLKRVIQKDLVHPIARKLLACELEDGSVIQVSAGEGALEIGKARVH